MEANETDCQASHVTNSQHLLFKSNLQFCYIDTGCGFDGRCKSMNDSDFDQFVGLTALIGKSVSSKYCDCNSYSYGAMCDKNQQEFQDFSNCGKFGVFDERNTITGCSCRESIDGNATEYHGWYCEIHNR